MAVSLRSFQSASFLMALLPTMYGFTIGTRKPAWRDYIPAGWSERDIKEDYWNQILGYAELAVNEAATDLKPAELIDRLPGLTQPGAFPHS